MGCGVRLEKLRFGVLHKKVTSRRNWGHVYFVAEITLVHMQPEPTSSIVYAITSEIKDWVKKELNL